MSFEPLRGTLAPLDTTALANMRLSVGFADRGGLVLAGGSQASLSDILVRATMTANTVHAPSPYVQGLVGRVVAMFPSGLGGELLIVTNTGVFGAPMLGGAARPMTPTIADMGNTDAALASTTMLVTTGSDSLIGTGLWLFDTVAQSLRFVPLRLPPPLVVASGPSAGTVLIGDSSGQVWTHELATQAQTPFARVSANPLTTLVANPDQRQWLASSSGAIHVFRSATTVVTWPLPTTAWAMTYRAFESLVSLRGVGCQGTGPQPVELSALGRPTPGNSSFVLTLASGPAHSIAILLLGGDRLDIGLDAFGLRGCRLYTTPLITLGASTGATGGAQYPLPVPPDPDLVGGSLQAQWLVRDPGANPGGFTTTNAGSIGF